MGEVVGALGGREEVEQAADGDPEVVDGALGGTTQQRLELGEGLLASAAFWRRSLRERIGRAAPDGLRSGE